MLVCPCRLPLMVGALAGTTAGALVSGHRLVALFSLAASFFFPVAQAWMALSEGSCRSRCEQARGPAWGAEGQERPIVSLPAPSMLSMINPHGRGLTGSLGQVVHLSSAVRLHVLSSQPSESSPSSQRRNLRPRQSLSAGHSALCRPRRWPRTARWPTNDGINNPGPAPQGGGDR
ncbi:MAG: hypothetical protein KGL42_12030 [Betaproteobacteria bacterium]|nr:hypothetical protein [Betaproteobacteria bacterium]